MIEDVNWNNGVLKKISVNIGGHATSISLERSFHQIIKNIASQRNQSLASLIAEIDCERPANINLSAALRLYVLHFVSTKSLPPLKTEIH